MHVYHDFVYFKISWEDVYCEIIEYSETNIRRNIRSEHRSWTLRQIFGVFCADVEKLFDRLLLKIDACFYGLTKTELRRIAWSSREKTVLDSIEQRHRIAIKVENFARRHQFSLRHPAKTSLVRNSGFNRLQVLLQRSYNNLNEVR